MSFEPRTRLEKILCGVAGAAEAARTRIEKAVAIAIANAGSGGRELPDIDNDDDGKVLTVDGNEAKWKNPADPTMVYAMSGTLRDDTEESTTLTLDKTALELFTAVEKGMLCKVAITSPVDDDGTMTITAVIPCEAFKVEIGGNTAYSFKMRADMSADDALFFVTGMSANDAVVLTAGAT